MFRLDLGRTTTKPPAILGGPVLLRPPAIDDHEAWRALREASRAHLTRWEPDWIDEDATTAAFRTRLRLYDRQYRVGAGLSLFVREAEGGALLGAVTLSDVRAHASHSGTIGYWIGEPFLRRGYGFAAVAAMLGYAFREMGLNRIEAACQPGNDASRALLAKAGFHEEGFARDYLYINGGWRDHLLFAVTARDYCGAPLDPQRLNDMVNG